MWYMDHKLHSHIAEDRMNHGVSEWYIHECLFVYSAGWEERVEYAESRNNESASVFTGYTSTESDNYYWNSIQKLGMLHHP